MSVLPFYGQPPGWDAAAGGLRLWGVLGYPDADNNVDRVTFLLTP